MAGYFETDLIGAPGAKPVEFTKQWAAKGFLNFNGNTNVVRKSRNVSSVTDNAAGAYTPNFTAPMADLNFVAHANSSFNGTNGAEDSVAHDTSISSSQFYSAHPTTAGPRDVDFAWWSIFGDLAP